MESEVMINKKRKWKFLGISLFLIIAIGVGLYFGYMKLNSNPSAIYKEVINECYTNINKYLKEHRKNEFDIDTSKEPLVLSFDTKLDSNIDVLKTFTNKKYELKLGLDFERKLATLDANISKDEENILDVLTLLKNNNFYLKSTKLIDKVLNLGEYKLFDTLNNYLDEANQNSFDYDALDYIIKNLKNSYIASLDKKNFEITKENDSSKKITYIMNNDNLNNTIRFILNNIAKDKKMLEALASISGYDASEIKDSIGEELRNDSFTSCEQLETSIYVDNFNNFLGFALNDGNDTIKIDLKDNKLDIKINIDNESFLLETNDDYISIKYLQNDKELINLKINNSNSEDLNMDFDINIDELTLNGNVILNNLINTKDKVAASYEVNIKTALDTSYLSLKGEFSLEKKEIEEFDTSGTVKPDELSEQEITDLYVKLMDIMDEFGI
ncbi:MAG: hypothetical protein NC483_07440, partial [Ruminococcus sp.]|nr:hypothetical protein [Ruminococcus sp.]